MNYKKLPIGIDDFAQLRQHDFYYVDKTGMIKEMLDNWGGVNLFTRPRRFGKSLNMSMLKYFFEIGTDKSLFDGLYISTEKELCDKYLGQFPVISLTLKQVRGLNFHDAKTQLWRSVVWETERHLYLQDSDKLDAVDKQQLYDLRLSRGTLEDAILQISKLLYKHYEKKVILLIDEYDVPLQKANQNGYYREMVELISNMFGYSMKSNPFMEFAVVTGCLRIVKESIFTGFNNPKIHTVIDNEYDEWFGFMEAEVQEMLKRYEITEYADLTKAWYDGYQFGKNSVYCPWAVINWCNQLTRGQDDIPRNFWANTSSNDLIRRFADKSDAGTRDLLGDLIDGKRMWKKINLELTYNQMDDDVENLWSILLMTGYLTVYKHRVDGYYELGIPNREVRNIFVEIVDTWFKETVMEDKESLQEFFKAVDYDDEQALEECINFYLEDSVSYFDGGYLNEKEYFYHGLILGMLRSRVGWITKSNREAGAGRLDAVTYPKRGKYGVIFEFKYAREENELESAAKEALRQITENNYDKYFYPRKMEKVVHFGVAFHKKQCRVLKNVWYMV